MFAPTSSVQAPSRNSRRRQRESEGDTIKKPERKRSRLGEDTYRTPAGLEKNVPANTIANVPSRGPRKDGRTAGSRIDSSIYLTQTPVYAAKQLPAFPERLRDGEVDEYRASTLHGTSYALALTRTQAFIWDYTTSFSNFAPRIFTYPQPFKFNEHLPLGVLVTSTASTDIGLVIIGANTGKVIFWENIEVADATASLDARNQGVQGQISRGLHSSEVFVELLEAHHAGFLLRSSSGRIAHLTVRDEQGRGHVTLQWLEGQQPKPGLFGSIKKMFNTSYEDWQLAAVKVQPSTSKGHVRVTAITSKGHLSEWDIRWDGQQRFLGDTHLNGHNILTRSLQTDEALAMRNNEDYSILDYAILTPRLQDGDSLAVKSLEGVDSLMMLVAILDNTLVRYALVKIEYSGQSDDGDTTRVVQIISLDALRGTPILESGQRKSLIVPQPQHTTFIVLGKNVILASIDQPSLPHGSDPNTQPKPFEDILYLQKDAATDIIQVESEATFEGRSAADCLLFTKRRGMIRLSAEESSDSRSRLSMQIRLEQAIFYGSIPSNVFDLTRRPDYPVRQEELETAIQSVSSDILTSRYPQIPSVTQSALEQLRFRIAAMLDLGHYVSSNYPNISHELKWQMLWSAEKIAAVAGVWQAHESRTSELAKAGKKDRPLLIKIVDMAHEKQSRESSPIDGASKASEHDWLRRWFVLDARSIEKILPLAYNGMYDLYKGGGRALSTLLTWTQESDEIVFAALETALEFRQENAATFGLGNEQLEDGILSDNSSFTRLPEFWTSRLNIVNAMRQLTEFAGAVTVKGSDAAIEVQDDALVDTGIRVLAEENVRLVDVTCRVFTERQRWLLGHEGQAEQLAGERWKLSFENEIRPALITGLARLGQAERGMDLAERFGDLASLVDLSLEELRYFDPSSLAQEQGLIPQEKERYQRRFERVKSKIAGYEAKFGGRWIETFYRSQTRDGLYYELLAQDYGPEEGLSAFLCSFSERAKLGWMNELLKRQNIPAATEMLLLSSTLPDTNAWARTVELSLAKLACIAAESQREELASGDDGTNNQTTINSLINKHLSLSRIQTKLYDHVKHTAHSAMDAEAGLQLVMETFGKNCASHQNQKAHYETLKLGFEQLLDHQVLRVTMLIDVLTLMDSVPSEVEADDISGTEMILALQTVRAYWLEGSHEDGARKAVETLIRLIWKRCFIADDWDDMSQQNGLADFEIKEVVRQTILSRTLAAGTSMGLWDAVPSFCSVSPSAAVGALSDAQELNALYFQNGSEDLATAMAVDNVADDELLRHYLEECQLDQWFASAKEVAREDELAEAERKTEEQERMYELADAIQEPTFKRIAEGDMTRLGQRHLELDGDRHANSGSEGGWDSDAYPEDEASNQHDGANGAQIDVANGFDMDGDVEMT